MSERSSCSWGLFLNPILKNMVKLVPFSLHEKETRIFKRKIEQPFKTTGLSEDESRSSSLQLRNYSLCSPHIAATLHVT